MSFLRKLFGLKPKRYLMMQYNDFSTRPNKIVGESKRYWQVRVEFEMLGFPMTEVRWISKNDPRILDTINV